MTTTYRGLTLMMKPLALSIAFVFASVAAAQAPSELPPDTVSPLRWTQEQSLVGLRNMHNLFPSHVVQAGDYTRALPAGAPIDVRFEHDGSEFDVDGYMAAHGVSGILVLNDGAIVLERYAHGRGPDDLWASYSVAKSVTSTLVGAAIEDGYIESLDTPLVRYLPEVAGSEYAAVTVRQLLMMSSGIAWNEDYVDPESDIGRVYGTPSDDPDVNPVISYMRRLPRAEPAGAAFNYSTGETDLVGFLLSRATGKNLAAYLEEKIWRPFGMEHDAAWQLDVSGHERGGCCMSVSLRDYARFGLFMLEGGRVNGDAVLPDGWIEEATTNQLAEAFPTGGGYGYFWWAQSDGAYQAVGIFGQMIHIVPEQQLVVVVNSAWPAASDNAHGRARRAFVDAVRRAVR
jgi:CubicO group peptidase (beta-lactamase class C family)